jgi:PAS domain S-box-containing protein
MEKGESRSAQSTEWNPSDGRPDRQQADGKRIEEFLRESEERFRTFLDHAPNVAFMKSNDGRYLYVNRRFEEVFHLASHSILGKTDGELFPREQAEQFQANDRLVTEAGKAMEFEETARYTNGLHTSIVVKFPLRDGSGRIYATGGIATDITERKRVQEELLRSQAILQQQGVELQDMTAKLLTTQESERQRIARELHDDFSQRLAALVFDVASLEQQPPLLPGLTGKALEPIREQLEQLSDDIHNLAYTLHPSLLQHAGLQPAIEDYIHKVTVRTGLRIVFKARGVVGQIPLDQSTCLFRILQEGLQNVAKHADATDVAVQLSGSSHGVGLSIIDNGKGFDAGSTTAHPTGLGLISMQERLRSLNGFMRIHSRQSGGTKLCAWIPSQERAS